MDKTQPYPKTAMLPNVDYKDLEDAFFSGNLVDLEFETMRTLSDFTEQFKEILLTQKMVQIPELMVAHLCAYLGFFTASCLGVNQSENLHPNILAVLKKQATHSLKKFSEYPINSTCSTHELQKENLQHLRGHNPSSIIAQTVRLGRVIIDAMEELSYNQKLDFSQMYQKKKQTELFCPQPEFKREMQNNNG
jgi:hypothetical protein